MKLQRPALAVLAGTVATLVWGMIFWGVLADPFGVYRTLPNAPAVTELLQQNDTPTGTYFVPWPRKTDAEFEEFVAHHERGSFYELRYIRQGVDPNGPGKLSLGTLHYAVVAAMAVGLLLLLGAVSFRKRAGLVFLAGVMGSVFITISDPVWFHLPWDYVAGVLVFELVSWVLLAASTAAVMKPAD